VPCQPAGPARGLHPLSRDPGPFAAGPIDSEGKPIDSKGKETDMTGSRIAATGLVLGATLMAWAHGGRAQQQPPPPPPPPGQGAAEKAGERLDEAAQKIKRGLGEVAEDLRARFRRTRESVQSMGVEARVYGRIHWDKALADAPIELDVSTDGVATLRGSVADAAAKAKAVALARDTVGVTQVVDELAVTPRGTTIRTTTGDGTIEKKTTVVPTRPKP
jgi:hyperosmotically inducible periplasmic protein